MRRRCLPRRPLRFLRDLPSGSFALSSLLLERAAVETQDYSLHHAAALNVVLENLLWQIHDDVAFTEA